jgi:hypothetical protein
MSPILVTDDHLSKQKHAQVLPNQGLKKRELPASLQPKSVFQAPKLKVDEDFEMNTPIKHLNGFNNDWRIKARIIKKGDIREWQN